jgi:hypothetical protein
MRANPLFPGLDILLALRGASASLRVLPAVTKPACARAARPCFQEKSAPGRHSIIPGKVTFTSSESFPLARSLHTLCFLIRTLLPLCSSVWLCLWGHTRARYGNDNSATTWTSTITRCDRWILGELTKKSYQIAQDFRLPARRAKGHIAGLCNPLRNTAGGRKDKQAGNFFDRDRLNTQRSRRFE